MQKLVAALLSVVAALVAGGCITCPCRAPAGDRDARFPILEGSRYGFIDGTGDIVIQSAYE